MTIPDEEAYRVRSTRPAGAVLSIRVPREVAVAVDEFATANGLTLSETVRLALERLLSGAGVVEPGGVHGSTTAPTLTIALRSQPVGQRTQGTETRQTQTAETTEA